MRSLPDLSIDQPLSVAGRSPNSLLTALARLQHCNIKHRATPDIRTGSVNGSRPVGAVEAQYSDHDHNLILVVDDIAKGRPVSKAWARE
jgi:hypothetical protein